MSAPLRCLIVLPVARSHSEKAKYSVQEVSRKRLKGTRRRHDKQTALNRVYREIPRNYFNSSYPASLKVENNALKLISYDRTRGVGGWE